MEPPNFSEIKTLYSFDTEFSADSVEWCPHKPLQNLFVCANYHLVSMEQSDAESQERLGRILLLSVTHDSGLRLLQTINTAAVLDQKWCHNQLNGFSILGVVNAKKGIEIYKLNPESFQLELITSYVIEDESDDEVLILSLDWCTGKFSSQEPEIICSDSKGSWHCLKLSGNELVLKEHNRVHDYEAWIAAFYYWDPNIFFTGGDDSVLLKFDQRMGPTPIIKSRQHEAGVTCIHSNAQKEFLLATGSYDENLSLWDVRNMKLPSANIKMPGPLWRLKWDPFTFNYLLSACMLGGAHVIKRLTNEDIKIIASYQEHKSITYGADWSYLNNDEVNKFSDKGNILIGTCSFYDHLLCVSKFDLL